MKGSEVSGVQEGIEVQKVQGVFGGIGVFCKNLLHVSSCYMYLYQVDICTYIKVLHPYNPFSFSSFLLFIIMGGYNGQ